MAITQMKRRSRPTPRIIFRVDADGKIAPAFCKDVNYGAVRVADGKNYLTTADASKLSGRSTADLRHDWATTWLGWLSKDEIDELLIRDVSGR